MTSFKMFTKVCIKSNVKGFRPIICSYFLYCIARKQKLFIKMNTGNFFTKISSYVSILFCKIMFLLNMYLFKVTNTNTKKRCEICSKLTIKTLERSQWRRSGVFIINFEHIPRLFLVCFLLNLNKLLLSG